MWCAARSGEEINRIVGRNVEAYVHFNREAVVFNQIETPILRLLAPMSNRLQNFFLTIVGRRKNPAEFACSALQKIFS